MSEGDVGGKTTNVSEGKLPTSRHGGKTTNVSEGKLPTSRRGGKPTGNIFERMRGTQAALVYIVLRVIKGLEMNAPVFLATTDTISGMCGVERHAVSKSVNKLVELNIIERVSPGYYTFIFIPWEKWGEVGMVENPPSAPKDEVLGDGSSVTDVTHGTAAARRTSSFGADGRKPSTRNEIVAGLSSDERREIVHTASRLIGYHGDVHYVGKVMAKVTRRLRAGATSDELLDVVRWHAGEWSSGRDRWSPRHSLQYLWGDHNFAPLLACARAADTTGGGRAYVVPGGGSDDPVWRAAQDEKIKRLQATAEGR